MKSLMFLVALMTWASAAPNAAPAVSLRAKSDQIALAIRNSKIPAAQLGIYIATIKSNALLANVESDKLMNPASVSKLVTAGAVLANFPPGYNFITRITTSGQQVGSTLKGDIYIKGVGDPSLEGAEFWKLMNDFRLSGGIKNVEGNLIVDDSMQERYLPPKTQASTLGQMYQPITGALTFSSNKVVFNITSASAIGSPLAVSPSFPSDYVQVIVKASVGQPKSADQLLITQSLDPSGKLETFTLTGSMPKKNRRTRLERYLWQPDLWAGHALKEFFKTYGVTIKGEVKRGVTDPKAVRILAGYRSPPIESLVTEMNKDSNNFYAEMLTTALSGLDQKKATLNGGLEKIRKFYSDLRPPLPKMELASPSGLTRDNRLSAKGTWQFLNIMQNNSRQSLEYMSSLAIGHADGTLKNRFDETVTDRKVRAKSGYLSGVVALAGYVWLDGEGYIPFAFFYNGKGQESQAENLFDEMIKIITR